MATPTTRVLITGRLHPAGLELLEGRADVAADVLEAPTPELFAERLAPADAVLLRTQGLDARMIEGAPRLRIVARHGVGYDNVDVGALTARGIPLTVVGEANAVAVAEHAMMLLLAVTKRGVVYDREMRAGNYRARDSLRTAELDGKAALVVGFGRIGRRVAGLCRAFGMAVTVADPYVPAGEATGRGFRHVADFRDALGGADVVTLHLPAVAGAPPVFGAPEFAAMREGAYFINTARGALVDEPALVAALTSGRLRGAGLDVTREEPPPPDQPLLGLDNVVLSPHSAAATPECFRRMAVASVQNILDFLDGQLDPAVVVNPEALTGNRTNPSRPRFQRFSLTRPPP